MWSHCQHHKKCPHLLKIIILEFIVLHSASALFSSGYSHLTLFTCSVSYIYSILRKKLFYFFIHYIKLLKNTLVYKLFFHSCSVISFNRYNIVALATHSRHPIQKWHSVTRVVCHNHDQKNYKRWQKKVKPKTGLVYRNRKVVIVNIIGVFVLARVFMDLI